MSVAQNIKDTKAFRAATELVESIHNFSNKIPDTEFNIYGMNSKLRDSVSHLPDYIEEGYKKSSKIERMKTFFMAQNSLDECKNYLSQAKRMKLGETEHLEKNVDTLRHLLFGESSSRSNVMV